MGNYPQAVDAVSRAAGLALGGTPTEGVVAAAASPYINEQIKHASKNNPTANTIAHAVWGAVESKFQGGSAAAGAMAAAVGELGAAYIAEKLYGTNDPNKLTEEQKQTITELSKTAAGLASGLTSAASGGNSTNIAQATQTGQGIAESAVENNLLSREKDEHLYQLSEKFYKKGNLFKSEREEATNLIFEDEFTNNLLNQYQSDKNSLSDTQKAILFRAAKEMADSYHMSIDDVLNMNLNNAFRRDDKSLKNYLNFSNSWNMRVAESTSEAMAYSPLILPAKGDALGAMALGAGTDFVGQTIINNGDISKIDLSDLALATAVSRVTNGKGFVSTVGINVGTSYANAERKRENSAEKAMDSLIFTSLGYGAGKIAEKTSEKVLHPSKIHQSYMESRLNTPLPIYGSYKPNNIPSRIGSVVDPLFSKSIEVIKEVDENEKK